MKKKFNLDIGNYENDNCPFESAFCVEKLSFQKEIELYDKEI